MEIIFLMVLPATLWAQSWYFLDLYNNTKTLGIMAAAAAIMLGGLVIFTEAASHPWWEAHRKWRTWALFCQPTYFSG